MYKTQFFLNTQQWGVVDGNDVLVRLFASYEAAQRYAENKNNEAR